MKTATGIRVRQEQARTLAHAAAREWKRLAPPSEVAAFIAGAEWAAGAISGAFNMTPKDPAFAEGVEAVLSVLRDEKQRVGGNP